jgi:hypothetical protein
MEAAELLCSLLDHGIHLLGIGDIGRNDERFATQGTDFLGHALEFLAALLHVIESHRALSGKAKRDGAPDAAARSSDERNPWRLSGTVIPC